MDELDNLVVENKKSHKGKIFSLLVLLICAFFSYKVLAPDITAIALDELPRIVYTKTQDISGCGTQPNSKIKIVLNGNNPIFIDADESGCIKYSVELDEGINKIDIYDLSANKSEPISIQIEYVIKPPSLEISQPLENSEIKVAIGKKDQEITIKGKTDVGVDVFVNGDKILVDDNGEFETKIQLSLGENKINVIADSGEKTTEKEITVKLVEETKANSNSSSSNNNNTNSSNSSNSSDSNNDTSNNQQPTNQNQSEPPPLVIYPSKVIISYILYSNDPSASGYNEYIELKNTGDESKDITGWTISDSDGNSFTFPAYILTSGSTVRITTNSGRFLFNSAKPVWDRLGEAGYLKDASGKLVDAYSY